MSSDATADKPQSKCWYHDGWWAILSDGVEGARFYRLIEESEWQACDSPDAVVSPDINARVDVSTVALGESVFGWSMTVLAWSESALTARVYDRKPGAVMYRELRHHAVTLDIPAGHETATIARHPRADMVTAVVDGEVLVAEAIPLRPTVLASGLSADDISAVVTFPPPRTPFPPEDTRVGVFWSDQNTQSLGFRWRAGSDPRRKWRPLEIVAQGGHVADDHINIAAAADGTLYVVTKTSVDDVPRPVGGPTQAQIILSVRAYEGGWSLFDVVPVTDVFTSRPIVVLDETNDDLYVFYRHGDDILYRVSPRDAIDFGGAARVALSQPGVTLRNVTSAKYSVSARTGLLVMATGSDGMAYSTVLPIDDGSVDTAP